MKLQTGGKGLSQRQNLFRLSAGAEAYAPTGWGVGFYGDGFYDAGAIPSTDITIDGLPLGSDGKLWRIYADNDTRDVTPTVKNKDFYTFTVNQQKYHSYFEVFVNQPYPGATYYTLETAGHAFWQFRTDAPEDALQHISPSLTVYLNHNWGFYPHGADCGLPGLLANDDTHGYAVKRVFYIGFPDLISGLQFTRELSNAPPEYCIAINGYSCVGAAREAGRNADVWLPSDWTPQNFGVGILLKYQPASVLSDDTPRYSH